MARQRATPIGGYSIGLLADTHIGQGLNVHRVVRCVEWLRSLSPKPVAIVHAGDITISAEQPSALDDWLEEIGREEEWILTCGNHDTEVEWAHDGDVPDRPHATIVDRYPELFGGREWYTKDVHSARVIVTNNNSDCLATTGYSCYHNCNPPGERDAANPDHSGITVSGSVQRQWLDRAAACPADWKMVVGHRALWVPYDTDPRPMNRGAREAMRRPIELGVSLLFTGDVHVGALSGPWYPDQELRVPGTVGCYSLSLAGGYAVRQVDESVLPEGACLWSDGGTGALGICHAGALVFGGAKVRLLVYRVAADDEEGSVVLETDLERNPGSPPSGPPVCRESRTRRGRDGRILSPTAAALEDRDVAFGEIVS